MTAEPYCPEPAPEREDTTDPDPDRREGCGDPGWYDGWEGPDADALIDGVMLAHDLMEAALNRG